MIKDSHKPLFKIALIGLGFLLIVLWGIHVYNDSNTPEFTPPSVVVQTPIPRKVVEYVTQTGTLVAYNSVDLVARIEGFLEKIKFTDGGFVKKGQELFVVEPEPYWDQLKEAQASVTSQQASFAYSKIEHQRQQKMYDKNATSLNSVQEWETKVLQSQAEVDKAIANERNAAITYSYTHVLAPFDGRMGRHLVDIGNLVGNGAATKLATIEQINPIYVYFNLNELDLFKVRKTAHEHGISPDDLSSIPVYVSLQGKTDFSHEGTLNFVNTGLNASTGTMEFRALLPNDDLELLPGLFVQARVPISLPTTQLTVPEIAVQYDQIGAYLYIVDAKNKVVIKRVTLGPTENNYRAITQGLNKEDNVIIEGLQNAAPGIQVTPLPADKASL
jgi:RND family efflux transporter MFP subunit